MDKRLASLKRAKDKNAAWNKLDLLRPEAEELVRKMILSVPGYYKLHSREYGTNLKDKIESIYGFWPSFYVTEALLLGMQAIDEKHVYASFTLGLDAIQIKK